MSTMGRSMMVPQKTENRVAMWFNYLTLGHIYRQHSNLKNTCTSVFIVALFTIAKYGSNVNVSWQVKGEGKITQL